MFQFKGCLKNIHKFEKTVKDFNISQGVNLKINCKPDFNQKEISFYNKSI